MNRLKSGIFLISFFVLFSWACQKEEDMFPPIYVNMNLLMTVDLNDVGVGSGKKFRITGSADSLIVVKMDINEFAAYSDVCTNYTAEGAYHQVRLDAARQIATCPSCHSHFMLAHYGNQISGSVAPRPLHAFQTLVQGNRLYISN